MRILKGNIVFYLNVTEKREIVMKEGITTTSSVNFFDKVFEHKVNFISIRVHICIVVLKAMTHYNNPVKPSKTQ